MRSAGVDPNNYFLGFGVVICWGEAGSIRKYMFPGPGRSDLFEVVDPGNHFPWAWEFCFSFEGVGPDNYFPWARSSDLFGRGFNPKHMCRAREFYLSGGSTWENIPGSTMHWCG